MTEPLLRVSNLRTLYQGFGGGGSCVPWTT